MPLQGSGEMSFGDVYNEITGESLVNPPISITQAELGQLQNSNGQTIGLNQYYTPRPDGNLPTVFPTEWYLYCQKCNQPAPYLTISKSAPSSSNISSVFTYSITVVNNGTTPTSGTITITDNLPSNLSFVSAGSGFNVTVNGQLITATFSGVINVGVQITFTINVQSSIAGAYNNFASVSGGGETVTKTSNTTTTNVAQVYFNSSVTKRLVRTFQKNDCGAYGSGANYDVYSPFFTGTYQSTISQGDADSNANINANNLCNAWLDANGQGVANQNGACIFVRPQITLGKSMPSNLNVNETADITITLRNFNATTTGTITLTDYLDYGFDFISAISTPSPFSFSMSGRTIIYVTNNSLPPNYEGIFVFRIRAVYPGTWFNESGVQNSSIQDASASSNRTSTLITGNPTFSFSSGALNNDFDNGLFPRHAAPTDEAYYFMVLTINNAPSTSETIPKMEFILPANFLVINNISVFFDTGYFIFSQGSQPNIAAFEQRNNVTVPQGQYSFYVRINLPIEYYRMSATSSNENDRPNDNLIIDSTGSSVSRMLTTSINTFVNNSYQNTFYPQIIWSNNYKFLPIFLMCNGNNLSNNIGLTYRFAVNNIDNFSAQMPINQVNNEFYGDYIYVVNPTRDTNPGVLNSYYPNQNPYPPESSELMFGIFIYYQIFYYNTQLKLCDNPYSLDANDTVNGRQIGVDQIYINRTYNEPKSRPTKFRIFKNGNGNYVSITNQEIFPEI